MEKLSSKIIKELKKISLDHLLPHERVNQKKVNKLVKDIEENGLKYPIIVMKYRKNFIIVDGHHRVEAFKILGKKKIDAIVINYFSKKLKVFNPMYHEIKKNTVIKAIKNPLPPKSTRHMIMLKNRLVHVSYLSKIITKLKIFK